MNFAEIETFLMIVDTKSITKTAENLFLSQPTVSHRLKTLETELNMQLVIRKKGYKTVELTSRGDEFIPIADRWMSLWKETQMLQHGTEKHFLTLGCIDTLSSTLLFPFYSSIIDADVPISLKIRTHQSYEIYELLEKHEIDIGFVFHNLYFMNIISEPLVEEEMYIVQPKDTPFKRRKIHTDELDPARELYFNWDTNYQIWHDQWISRMNRPTIQVDTFQLIVHFMQRGDFWLIAPTSIVRALLKYDSFYVSEIANNPQPPKRITYRIRHKAPHKSKSKAVEIFDQALTEYLKKATWKNLGFIGAMVKED
ncbi:MAG: LysR family transcriptional regulator [Lachnospiraceae bacterium]|nr:LysR family transcriptional regulator [Lachnospiraceae bacterium]